MAKTGKGQTADSFILVCLSITHVLCRLCDLLWDKTPAQLISCDTPNTNGCVSDCFMVSSGLQYQ